VLVLGCDIEIHGAYQSSGRYDGGGGEEKGRNPAKVLWHRITHHYVKKDKPMSYKYYKEHEDKMHAIGR
jgi:hypothetical protein